MSHRLKGFEPYKGDMEMRQNGSLIAMETGTAYAYAINKLQDRGTFFVSPQDEIYAGQVVGESTRSEDIVINLTKSKKLTNMRASGSDDKVSIAPPGHFLARGSARIYQGGRVCRGDAQVDPPAQDHSRRDDAQASGEIAGFPGSPQRRGKTGARTVSAVRRRLEPGANLHFTVSPLSERFLTGAISVLGGLSEASFSFLIKKSSARLRCRRFRVVRKLRLSDGPAFRRGAVRPFASARSFGEVEPGARFPGGERRRVDRNADYAYLC